FVVRGAQRRRIGVHKPPVGLSSTLAPLEQTPERFSRPCHLEPPIPRAYRIQRDEQGSPHKVGPPQGRGLAEEGERANSQNVEVRDVEEQGCLAENDQRRPLGFHALW